jgi:hypothetical protein
MAGGQRVGRAAFAEAEGLGRQSGGEQQAWWRAGMGIETVIN